MFPSQCKDDMFRCVSYLIISPSVLVLGLVGSMATLTIMAGSTFRTPTFFYLRVLSISDMMFLLSAVGIMVENMIIQEQSHLPLAATYYLTHFDHILCNTFISTSGFIIIILTLDRYRCICHPTMTRDTSPSIYCMLALLVSFTWQVPRFFTKSIVSDCVQVDQNTSTAQLGSPCECSSHGGTREGSECRYQRLVINTEVNTTYPWVIYVVLAELFVKVLPSVLLVSLNTMMISRFHEVIERRSIMQAKSFVEGTTKLSLIADITDIQKTNLATTDIPGKPALAPPSEDNQIRQSKSGQRKVHTIRTIYRKASGFRLNTESVLQKAQTIPNEQPTPKSYMISRKEKSLIKLLFVLSLVFFVANIPMAIARILVSLGFTNEDHIMMKVFFIICNLLEFFFAASNFYLYCFCNAKIRRKVLFIFNIQDLRFCPTPL